MIRQRITIQGQIKVLTTQGKLSGAIVGLLPFGLARSLPSSITITCPSCDPARGG